MAKRRRKKGKQRKAQKQKGGAPQTPQQLGNRAFRQGEFGKAIEAWGKLDGERDERVGAALAEAHFRRGLAAPQSAEQAIADLRRAVELCLDEPRYWYHLGLALHGEDQVEEACAAYARAVDLGYQGEGLGFTRGLAEVERDPEVDLERLTWLSAEDREALMPVAALLRGTPQAVPDETGNGGPGALWSGLALLSAGEEEPALAALSLPKGQQLRTGAEQVRLFYLGLAAAKENRRKAVEVWEEARRAASRAHLPPQPRLLQGLDQLRNQRLYELQREQRWEALLNEVERDTADPETAAPTLLQIRLTALQRLARKGVEEGDWDEAIAHWAEMAEILGKQPALGARVPLLRNVAIAWEGMEAWEEAAEAWAVLLGMLSRRGGAQDGSGVPVDQQRDWLRRRIVEDFQRAGLPDRAIGHFKQVVKAAPEDLEVRLELAEALLENEQSTAARNEVRRVLEQDEKHVEALLLLAEIHEERDEEEEAEEVLRRVLEIDPGNEQARQGMVETMMTRGVEQFNSGDHHGAWEIYTQALEYGPDDIHLLVLLGDTELALGDTEAAKERFDQALGTGQVKAYSEVFECWVKHQQEKEARRVLERAEKEGVASHYLYVTTGIICLRCGSAPLPLRGLFGRPLRARQGEKWQKLGRELIDRGLELAPDRGQALEVVTGALGPGHPELALQYARQRVELAPDDPEAMLALGLLQAMSEDEEAKETLKKAEGLARSRGDRELAREIASARRQADSPMFGMMGSVLADLGAEFDEE